MNEKNVEQVLEIEKQARAIQESAQKEAEQLPIQAEQESQAIIEKARADAEQEAQKMIQAAQAEEEKARILEQVDEKIRRTESLASNNFNRAVSFVLNRVVGKE